MNGIDIVVRHVDGSVPGFAERCREYTGDYVPCQYRDLGELRYVLRSISENAPWANVILAVQDKRHVPDYVDTRALRIVEHDAFIPAGHLPTFHWATILAHLDRIPGLSERYIAWSDDVAVSRPISADDFFDADELPRTGFGKYPVFPATGPKVSRYQAIQIESSKFFREKTGRSDFCLLYPHMPVAMTRALWREQFELFGQDPVYSTTVTMKSRGKEDEIRKIDPTHLFTNWVDICKRRRGPAARFFSMMREALLQSLWQIPHVTPAIRPRFGKYAIVNDTDRMKHNMARLLREQATFLNVNDDAYDSWGWPGSEREVNPESLDLLHGTLAQLFPEPGRYEWM